MSSRKAPQVIEFEEPTFSTISPSTVQTKTKKTNKFIDTVEMTGETTRRLCIIDVNLRFAFGNFLQPNPDSEKIPARSLLGIITFHLINSVHFIYTLPPSIYPSISIQPPSNICKTFVEQIFLSARNLW